MKKILIAEDSSVIQNLIKKVLSQTTNHEFKTVKNGESLLSLIEEEDFDLFLVDINIPKIDGIQCAAKIRNHKTQGKKPIIAITGNANNYTAEEFLAFGFNDFLIKPLNFDALVQKVQEYLG